MPKLKASLSSLLLLPAVFCDPSGEITATIIAAVLHEAGHLLVIILLGIGIKEIRITPYGLEIDTLRKYSSFFQEFAVNCAGCTVNFAVYFFLIGKGIFLSSVAYASVVLGVLNGLPIKTLDGGEVVFAVLSSLLPYKAAYRISHTISFFTVVALWVIAAYIFLFSGYNYSLFIMSVWLFAKIYCEKK